MSSCVKFNSRDLLGGAVRPVRARCAHISGSGLFILGVLTLALALPDPLIAQGTVRGPGPLEPAQPPVTHGTPLTLDLGGTDDQGLSPMEPELLDLMDGLARSGFWLLPQPCATLPVGDGDPMARTRDALFEQDPQGVRAGALDGLLALACGDGLAAPSAVALPWFYLGVGDLLEGKDLGVERYFAAVHALSPPGFTPPELGQQARERFDAAAAGIPEGPTLNLKLPDGVTPYLDGAELPRDGLALTPVPHVLQIVSPEGRPYGQLLLPESNGWRLGPGGDVVAVEDIGVGMLERWNEDVIRFLRVPEPLSPGEEPSDIAVFLGEAAVTLTVTWEGADGERRSHTLRPAPQEPAEEDHGGELEPTDDASIEALVNEAMPQAIVPLDSRHRVGVSLGAGASVVRGALFTPMVLGDASIQTPLPFDLELGFNWGMDPGRQGAGVRAILGGRSGVKFQLREDIGLSASLGLLALTRGPDPDDPTIFVIEGMGGAWLRVRPPKVGPLSGPYVELGGGFSPGVWRADGGANEGPGTTAWLLVGYERR